VREKLLVWGFGLGLARELFMFSHVSVQLMGMARRGPTTYFAPEPLEHALTTAMIVVVAGAFVRYILRDVSLSRRYLWIGLLMTGICYVVTSWWWVRQTVANAESRFSQGWGDLLFHTVTAAFIGIAIALITRKRGWLRNTVSVALVFFFLDEFLRLCNFATARTYARIFCPVANSFHIWAIPLLGYVYLREQSIEKRQAKEELEVYREHLEELVEERTTKLTRANEQLQWEIAERKQAEQQAVRAERLAAMGWLAAALAHEINNPLQAIRSNLELVLDFDLELDEREEYLHVVSQEIQRLTEITRRVLDFARPADDTRYPIPIAHLIQETLKLMGKQLQLAHIQATTDLPADLPSVFVAPDQILQVLFNLSVNAIEAMPDGGHLHIAARADENVVEIALTNDGPPLPAEHIKRIFDPFFTTKPDGAGLGLSISHSIVHRHGGTISVGNLKDHRGVVFTIALPVARLVREEEVGA